MRAATVLPRLRSACMCAIVALLMAACGTAPLAPPAADSPEVASKRDDITFFSLSLLGTGYTFGGKNPEAGLDCSGMVSYVYREAAGIHVSGSAADIARHGREIARRDLRPGDLVFFNTLGRPFSHVGIYIGKGQFIHAPSTNGKVRIARMDNKYFAKRFEMARSYLP